MARWSDGWASRTDRVRLGRLTLDIRGAYGARGGARIGNRCLSGGRAVPISADEGVGAGRLTPRRDVELAEDGGDVMVDRADRHHQPVGDLGVGEPGGVGARAWLGPAR